MNPFRDRIAIIALSGIVALLAFVSGANGQQPAKSKHQYGIFGFGSLIADPGEELAAATESRKDLETPFAIEYGRSSNTRGGAPTLVPVKTGGAKVKAIVFVLKPSISEQEAQDILYRREIHQVGSGKTYTRPAKAAKNSLLVAAWPNLLGLDKIFYTDFADAGKLSNPTPKLLAELATKSASDPEVKDGMDGISYLINAKSAGIRTPLSADYEKEILKQTGTASLEQALAKLRPSASAK